MLKIECFYDEAELNVQTHFGNDKMQVANKLFNEENDLYTRSTCLLEFRVSSYKQLA